MTYDYMVFTYTLDDDGEYTNARGVSADIQLTEWGESGYRVVKMSTSQQEDGTMLMTVVMEAQEEEEEEEDPRPAGPEEPYVSAVA